MPRFHELVPALHFLDRTHAFSHEASEITLSETAPYAEHATTFPPAPYTGFNLRAVQYPYV